MLQLGCILGPPLENAAPLNNHPTYIPQEAIFPTEQPYIASSTDAVPLSIQVLHDEDPEEVLYAAFYSPELGILKTQRLARENTEPGALENGIFYRFEGTSFSLNPCLSDLRGLTSVTVFFYLSDRDWQGTGINGVIPAEDAYVSTHAWAIDLSNAGC